MPKRNGSNKKRSNTTQRQQHHGGLDANVLVRHKYRFSATSANETNVTCQSIMTVAGAMGTVLNTNVNPISKAFKIHSIKIMSSPGALGAAASCSVEWYSADSGVMTTQTFDTTNTPDRPAEIFSRPPTSSAAWYWRSITNVGGGATTPMFNIQCAAGSIIELDVTHILNDTAYTSWPTVVAAAVLGQMYYSGLDAFGGVYAPVRLLTTA
jgi:hypothetical protein